jgi:PAS domain S-box-containing protein
MAPREAHLNDPIDLDDAENVLTALAGAFFPLHREAEVRFAAPDSETRYKTLVEQIPAVIFIALLGEGTGEAYVSPYIERVLGFTQEEWLNDPVRWYSQIHPDDRGRWSLEAADLFVSGSPLRSTYRVLARDGRVVWFSCEAKMVRDHEGHPWFIHGVGFDITDLKQVEEALTKSRDELELRVEQRTVELVRSNADLEQFAYAASHDLQEPVRNIAIYSQLLKERFGGKLNDEANLYLDTVVEGAARMGALIHGLLAFAHASSQVVTEGEQSTDANAALSKAVENLAVAVRDAGAQIEAGVLPPVRMSEVHLQQIFQNLISNAIKYRSEATPRIEISAAPGEDSRFHLFSVKDNGIGIEPQYHQTVFGLFKRLRGGQAKTGTGLGLAICKRSVERYGGKIWVESVPGSGSVFYFTAPTRPEAAEQTKECQTA